MHFTQVGTTCWAKVPKAAADLPVDSMNTTDRQAALVNHQSVPPRDCKFITIRLNNQAFWATTIEDNAVTYAQGRLARVMKLVAASY
jgi:hypothetical protein